MLPLPLPIFDEKAPEEPTPEPVPWANAVGEAPASSRPGLHKTDFQYASDAVGSLRWWMADPRSEGSVRVKGPFSKREAKLITVAAG